MIHFTLQLLEERISNFRCFISDHGWTIEEYPRGYNGVRPYQIYSSDASVMVQFSPKGGIWVWGINSTLKSDVLPWIYEEQPNFRDYSCSKLTLRPIRLINTTTRINLQLKDIQLIDNDVHLIDVYDGTITLTHFDAQKLVTWLTQLIDQLEDTSNFVYWLSTQKGNLKNINNLRFHLAECQIIGATVKLIDINGIILNMFIADANKLIQAVSNNLIQS